MDLLGVDAETAIQIQDKMIIDFSECTKREFNAEVKFIYSNLKLGALA
jgi:hypothetical protein